MTPETAQLIRPDEDLVAAFDGSWHATPNNVARSRRALLGTLRDAGVAEPTLDAIGMAVAEVATNTVYHAYVGRRIGQFRITAALDAGEVTVAVEDDGSGFEDAAGRGLALVASLASRVEAGARSGGGTRTTMWFDRAL